MSNMPDNTDRDEENDVRSETLIVPPPGFRERLQAAQRARANETRTSVMPHSPLAKQAIPDEAIAQQPVTADDASDPSAPPTA